MNRERQRHDPPQCEIGEIGPRELNARNSRAERGDERLYESNNHHGNFLECVRSRRDPVAPVEAGHAATTLSLISDIATRARRKLTWDWEAERFVNDEGANRFLNRPMRSPWRM